MGEWVGGWKLLTIPPQGILCFFGCELSHFSFVHLLVLFEAEANGSSGWVGGRVGGLGGGGGGGWNEVL